MDILKFNIELLNNNHDEPYPIPSEIIDSEYAFEVMRQFLEAHAYSPKSFKVTKPITSKNYHELVDEATFKVCSCIFSFMLEFTSIGNA
jgi:phage-related protein